MVSPFTNLSLCVGRPSTFPLNRSTKATSSRPNRRPEKTGGLGSGHPSPMANVSSTSPLFQEVNLTATGARAVPFGQHLYAGFRVLALRFCVFPHVFCFCSEDLFSSLFVCLLRRSLVCWRACLFEMSMLCFAFLCLFVGWLVV